MCSGQQGCSKLSQTRQACSLPCVLPGSISAWPTPQQCCLPLQRCKVPPGWHAHAGADQVHGLQQRGWQRLPGCGHLGAARPLPAPGGHPGWQLPTRGTCSPSGSRAGVPAVRCLLRRRVPCCTAPALAARRQARATSAGCPGSCPKAASSQASRLQSVPQHNRHRLCWQVPDPGVVPAGAAHLQTRVASSGWLPASVLGTSAPHPSQPPALLRSQLQRLSAGAHGMAWPRTGSPTCSAAEALVHHSCVPCCWRTERSSDPWRALQAGQRRCSRDRQQG